MKNFEDLSGKKFGKLTVIKLDHRELQHRIASNWSVERALTTPIQKQSK